MSSLAKKQSELSLLAEHEKTIAELYRIYAQTFPDLADLWNTLAEEEIEHASWIQAFAGQVETGEAALIGCRFNPDAISRAIEYLKGRILAAPLEPLYHAFATSLDIETALLESKYYEVAYDASPQARRLLAALAEAAREHHHRLQETAGRHTK